MTVKYLVSYLCSCVIHTHSLVLEVLTGIHHYNTVYGGWEEAYKANYSHAEGRDGSKWSAVTARLAAICTFTCITCEIRRQWGQGRQWGRVDEYNWLITTFPTGHGIAQMDTVSFFLCYISCIQLLQCIERVIQYLYWMAGLVYHVAIPCTPHNKDNHTTIGAKLYASNVLNTFYSKAPCYVWTSLWTIITSISPICHTDL